MQHQFGPLGIVSICVCKSQADSKLSFDLELTYKQCFTIYYMEGKVTYPIKLQKHIDLTLCEVITQEFS